jgi:DNA-binding protein HU-beta
MDKKELIDTITANVSITKTSKKQVDAVLTALADVVHGQPEVFVRGLGKFKWVDRAARTARNPRTGEAVEVAAKRALTFKATK